MTGKSAIRIDPQDAPIHCILYKYKILDSYIFIKRRISEAMRNTSKSNNVPKYGDGRVCSQSPDSECETAKMNAFVNIDILHQL